MDEVKLIEKLKTILNFNLGSFDEGSNNNERRCL